jgi:hypothetical protein
MALHSKAAPSLRIGGQLVARRARIRSINKNGRSPRGERPLCFGVRDWVSRFGWRGGEPHTSGRFGGLDGA